MGNDFKNLAFNKISIERRMKEVKGNTKQKSGSRLKPLWKDNVKSQHKDANQCRMTTTERKT